MAPPSKRTAPAETVPSEIDGASEPILKLLRKLGIRRRFDLALHLPIRYDDETRLTPIRDARVGHTVQVEGVITQAEVLSRPRRALICQVEDGTGALAMRFLHFYGSQVKTLVPGARVRLVGDIRPGFFGPEMVHPKCRLVKDDQPLPECLTPIYPTTAGLSQPALQRLLRINLPHTDLSDTLPDAVVRKHGYMPFEAAVRYLHFPPPDAALAALDDHTHPAWIRLKFDELLAQQLSMRVNMLKRRARIAPAFSMPGFLCERFRSSLPFELTGAQKKVITEIARDLTQAHPMHRLLQGDVGSGKTVVAAWAALQAVESGFQAAVMAPTEILAEQHYVKFQQWMEPLGVKVAWLAASLSAKEKRETLEAIADGRIQVAVGTHALFQNRVHFPRLGLVIVDEQHRFGVHQRLALREKGARREIAGPAGSDESEPHLLMMSATPIPRTLSMSYFADLDVSTIDALPAGRTPVATKLVSDARRLDVILKVKAACQAGAQVYWVCPLIEESETLELQAAEATFAALREALPELRIGLVHGRLPSAEKTTIMESFKRGDLHLLVATTVIEVGVDVPNASLMVIEHAERMGLSQLHQLRGRVGRGSAQSACILLYQQPLSEIARARLKIIYESADGFEIARQDLQLRGPGEFLGARQSGVPMLRFADISTDQVLLEQARILAEQLLATAPDRAGLHIERWLGTRHDYLKA